MRKRSRYRPKPVISDPLSLLRPPSKARVDAVVLRFLSAAEAMANGHKPTSNEWRDLSDCVNTIETLARFMGKLDPDEVMPTVKVAVDAMVECADRHDAGQGLRLSGLGLESLRTLIDWYRQCCEGLTEREMALAQAETQRRVNEILRRRRAAAERVVSV